MFSQSEADGLALINQDDVSILSIGISTGGEAELKMLAANPNRKVIATTLDEDGIRYVKSVVPGSVKSRLELKLENIADASLTYDKSSFDFIYARLVLHYLGVKELKTALKNIYNILKFDGTFFVVVRSVDSPELKNGTIRFDEVSRLTTYKTPSGTVADRYFHTVETISSAIEAEGFTITGVKIFDEDLSPGFKRDEAIRITNNLIEVVATKKL